MEGRPREKLYFTLMRLLLLHSQAEIREMLAFPLESNLGATTLAAESGAAGRALTEEKKFVPDVFIAESPKEITAYFGADKPANADFILCTNDAKAAPAAIPGLNFLGYALNADLAPNLIKLLQKKVPAESAEPAGDHTRINTSLLLKMNPLAADIYVRINPTKHVKLFNKNDQFDENDLKKYRDQKKVDYLYIRKADSQVFTQRLLEEIKKIIDATKPGDVSSQETVGDVVETIHDLINTVGVTEEVQQAVKGSVDAAMKSMGDFPELGAILKNLTEGTGKYIGRHTMLLTNVSCAIAVAMDWYSDATFEKLTMASFMHDAPLTNQELCAVKDLTEFEKKFKGKFNTAQIQEYKGHPERAVMLLGHFKEVPAEVDKIIAQHHEHPMGSGFPAALSSNYITPLSSLFIVAHDLTDYILDEGKNFNIDNFLNVFEKKYSAGNFKKIAKVLATTQIFEEKAEA